MFRSTNRPSQNFALIINILLLCSRVIGLEGASPNYRINSRTYFTFGIISIVTICTIINILRQFSENPAFLVEALCMLGTVVQAISKCLTFCLKTEDIVALRFELEHMYAKYEEKGSIYCSILQRSCKRLRKIMTVAGWITVFTFIGEHAVTIIARLVTGKPYLMLNYQIPGIDVTTTYGFLVTMGTHSMCLVVAGFGLFSTDMFVLTFPAHCHLFADIFEQKVRDLNESIAYDNESNQTKSMLEDLIEWHKKYNAFNEKCNDTFYYIIAGQITTSGLSTVCTLYIMLFGDWPTAYVYVFYPTIGLYAYCFLGTQINNCNDRVIVAVYDIDWFMLPIPEQKLVLMMLMKAQTPSEIQIGGIIQLSVNTGLQITKYIYSILMMMIECFDG